MSKYVTDPNVSNREKEHLHQCGTCQLTWQYLFRSNERKVREKMNIDVLSTSFANMTESERLDLCSKLIKQEKLYFTNLKYNCAINGFNVFAKSKQDVSMEFSSRMKLLSKTWESMSDEEKLGFNNESLKIRTETRKFIKNLDKANKHQYRVYRCPVPKPKKQPNSFMLFLKFHWAKSQSIEPWKKYHDVMSECTDAWKKMNQLEKSEFLQGL